MKLYIRNMHSAQCILQVLKAFENVAIRPLDVELGKVELNCAISEEVKTRLTQELQKFGLELIDDRKTFLVDRIKQVVIEMVYKLEDFPNIKTSAYLTNQLHYDYTYLSNTFTHVTGETIEQFIILHKIERVRYLLREGWTVHDIAQRLKYSSSAHLSQQFKKSTGLTPSFFKLLISK